MTKDILYSEIFINHTDNVADKWESYLEAYNDELYPIKDKVNNLLEIGVQNGGSLEVFSKYFHKAKNIVGMDINPKCREVKFQDPRIHIEIADAKSKEAKSLLSEKYINFDLILDDGSHHSTDIRETFFSMISLLSPGGYYIAEDLCCAYWQEFDGGVKNHASPMRLFKHLADIINFEHWRSKFSIQDFLSELGYKDLSAKTLEKIIQIRSITFYNSICIIKLNQLPNQNKIGKRVNKGNYFSLGFRGIDGQDINQTGLMQDNNPYNQAKISTFPLRKKNI